MDPIVILEKYYNKNSELYQILYSHSLAVAERALLIADERSDLKIDRLFVWEASLLHDIGICQTHSPKIGCMGEYDYICHGYLGAEMLRKEGLERHAWVCERHTGSGITKESIVANNLPIPHRDMIPLSIEEKLICFADKFYSKSHPERVKPIEKIRKSMAKYGEDSVARFDDMVKLFLD